MTFDGSFHAPTSNPRNPIRFAFRVLPQMGEGRVTTQRWCHGESIAETKSGLHVQEMFSYRLPFAAVQLRVDRGH